MGRNEMKIGIDCDGIVADFNPCFIDFVKAKYPDGNFSFRPCDDTYPHTWNYDKEAGVTPEQSKAIWGDIKAHKSFWLDIKPYPGAVSFLSFLSHSHDDIYFVTNRPALSAKWQTEKWLKRHGFLGCPTVLVSEAKGAVCKALKLDLYIDDKNENCEDVAATSPATICFRLIRPWNHAIPGTLSGNLVDFQNLVENGVI